MPPVYVFLALYTHLTAMYALTCMPPGQSIPPPHTQVQARDVRHGHQGCHYGHSANATAVDLRGSLSHNELAVNYE